MRHHVLSLFRQRRYGMQTIASMVLVTFTWMLVYPTVLVAQESPEPQTSSPLPAPDDEAELADMLTTMEEKLARFRHKLTQAEDTRLEHDEIIKLRQRLQDLDQRLRRAFDRTAQHLMEQGLPAEFLHRHQAIVATYETEVAILLRHLEALETASNSRDRDGHAARAQQHLQDKQKPRRHQRVDPQKLPFRVPDGKVRPPKETTKEFESALGTPPSVRVVAAEILPGLLAPAAALPATPTPEDLAPTEDVQMTEEITALAASLTNNPVKIYNWVHDTIAFVPTYGSVQGSHLTLQMKRGNAFDTASLLIALLRAAHIPARYVVGTVQIPIDQVQNWVGGVSTPEVAQQLLSQGGIPNTALISGGQIVAVKLEHVWVEGYVDFWPSQGAVHRQGDTWIPLDASFKQYHGTPGMALQTRVPFDVQGFVAQAMQGATVNAQEGWVQQLNQANIRTLLMTHQQQVQQFVVSQKPQATLEEMLGTRTIIAERRPVLAAGLPYSLVIRGTVLTTLPAALRHHVSVALYTNDLDLAQGEPALHYQISLPALHTQRLGVTFMPATSGDQQLIDSYKQQQATALPAYLLRVTPLIQLDGRAVATGPADTMGRRHIWSVTLRDPHGQYTSTEQFRGSAGDELVFGINGQGLTEAVLRARFARQPSETAAENLYTLSLCYWLLHDLQDQITAQLAGVAAQRLPSVGLFAVPLRVQYLFGIPHTATYRGRRMDVARALLAVAGPDAAKVVAFRQQSGWQGGYLEGAVFDMVFDHPKGTSISAVQLLQEANAQGIPLYLLTSQTLPGALPQLQLDADVLADLRAAVDTGKTVLVSAREVVRDGWTGVGYVIQDPVTGAGAYLIQGGWRGGEEMGALSSSRDPCSEENLEPNAQPIHNFVFSLMLFILLVALILATVAAFPALALAAVVGIALMLDALDVLPAVAWPVPTTSDGLWNAQYAPRYGPLLTQPPYPGDGIKSPGACSEGQVDSLHSWQKAICEQPGSRACKAAARVRNCPLAAQCARNANLCIEARLVVMFTCFSGGDEEHWLQVRMRLALLESSFDLFVGMAIVAGTAAVLFIGVRHVQSGLLSLGNLLMIMTYLSQLYAPLQTITKQVAQLQGSLASAERAFALLDETPEVIERPHARRLVTAKGAVAFQNVCFRYTDQQRGLQDISFHVEAGTRIGVAGTTGAGKTTLVSLLPRFYDPEAGQILLDGIDLREYQLADLRRQFSIVLQEPVLFASSIGENIAYARPESSQAEIIAAAKAAHAHEFISGMPDCHGTQVGERGIRLSGGERQRISIARAFLRDAPILILDEPTSSVDLATEAFIMEAMDRLMKGRTTFIIAHRLSTLEKCDVVLTIKDGRLATMTKPPYAKYEANAYASKPARTVHISSSES